MVENYSLKDSAEVTFFCLLCNEKVKEDGLFVVEYENGIPVIHHFSCHNIKKAGENK